MELGFPVHHYLVNTSRFEIQGFSDTLTRKSGRRQKSDVVPRMGTEDS